MMLNYYTGQDWSHLSDKALIKKFHLLEHIREMEAKQGGNALNLF